MRETEFIAKVVMDDDGVHLRFHPSYAAEALDNFHFTAYVNGSRVKIAMVGTVSLEEDEAAPSRTGPLGGATTT